MATFDIKLQWPKIPNGLSTAPLPKLLPWLLSSLITAHFQPQERGAMKWTYDILEAAANGQQDVHKCAAEFHFADGFTLFEDGAMSEPKSPERCVCICRKIAVQKKPLTEPISCVGTASIQSERTGHYAYLKGKWKRRDDCYKTMQPGHILIRLVLVIVNEPSSSILFHQSRVLLCLGHVWPFAHQNSEFHEITLNKWAFPIGSIF